MKPALVRCIICAFSLTAVPALAEAQKAIVLVRHAEKVDDSKDAELSDQGRARSAALARALRDAGITVIYSSDFRRTRNTAQPLADALKLQTTVMSAEPADVIAAIRRHGDNDVVLVVGHSNTIPDILEGLGCADHVSIGDPDYDNLFIVMPRPSGRPLLMRLHY